MKYNKGVVLIQIEEGLDLIKVEKSTMGKVRQALKDKCNFDLKDLVNRRRQCI